MHRHHHVAKLFAQHHDGAAIAELFARSWAPLGFNLFEPTLTLDVIVSSNQRMNICVCAVLGCVAFQNTVPQRVNAVRHIDRVALRFHGRQRVKHRLEHRQVRGAANVASVRWEIENNDGNLALGNFRTPQSNQLADSGGQHDGALGARLHVLRVIARLEGTSVVAACTGHASGARATSKHDGAGGAIQFGNRQHDGAFNRQQPTLRAAPLLQVLKLDRVRGDVGHIKLGKYFFGCLGVVVGWAADE